MLALRRFMLAAVAVGLSGALPACERNPAEAVAPREEVRLDGMVRSVDLAERSLRLEDGRVVQLGAAPADRDKDPLVMADRVLHAGGTVHVSGTGAGGPTLQQSSGPLTPQASFLSALVIEFTYDLVDEVIAVEPALGVYVLESGIPLFIDEGVVVDPAGDFTSLGQVAAALALGQRVNSTNEFRIRYTVFPFDVDLFLEEVTFNRL